MRHCVGGYASRVAVGDYLIYRVEGDERATVGFTRALSGHWILDQARGKFNAKVSAGLMKAADILAQRMAHVPPERPGRNLALNRWGTDERYPMNKTHRVL
jgi:hypothetical protein